MKLSRRKSVFLLWSFWIAASALSAGAQNFVFTSGNPKYDLPFADAKANIAFNTKGTPPNTVFHAGAFWDQVWTRDGNYSIEMACGLIDPKTSRNTFDYTTTTIAPYGKVQLQDVCGHFAGWPNLTDGIVWATGAWAFYRQTGDTNFLKYAYPIIRASLVRAEAEVRDPADSLFKGCSSFMESNSGYPIAFANNKTQSGSSVGNSKAGSTNMLHYNAYIVADSMAKLLGKPQSTLDTLTQKAVMLKIAINNNLWNNAKGYYYYIKYATGFKLDRNEGLADAFAILYNVADSAKKVSILANTKPSAWGYVCQYPQDSSWLSYLANPAAPTADYYHSNKIWPFVCGYIAWAGTKMRNQDVFMNNMDKVAQIWKKGVTAPEIGEFREFYLTESGNPGLNGGGQQLWSASGYISMVFHGLFGMNFDVDGVRFDPMVPDTFKNAMTLNNFTYRGMTLNMTVQGPGKYLVDFKLDGVAKPDHFISGTLTGTHAVSMTLSNTPVSTLPGSKNTALVNRGIPVCSNTMQGVSIRFGSYQKVNVSLYSLSGRSAGEFTTSNGIVTVSKKDYQPGAYVIKWHSENVDGVQKVLLQGR
jgi:hypothetical protein